jgi:hypothetical protein
LALVDKYVRELALDGRRVYLTGLSQGGIGTWGLASTDAYARRFAAIAPVCGGFVHANRHKRAATLADTPVWAFHGANDSILPVSLSDDSVAALQASQRTAYAGAPKYTRIEHARGSDYSWDAAGVPSMEGHASWVEACARLRAAPPQTSPPADAQTTARTLRIMMPRTRPTHRDALRADVRRLPRGHSRGRHHPVVRVVALPQAPSRTRKREHAPPTDPHRVEGDRRGRTSWRDVFCLHHHNTIHLVLRIRQRITVRLE